MYVPMIGYKQQIALVTCNEQKKAMNVVEGVRGDAYQWKEQKKKKTILPAGASKLNSKGQGKHKIGIYSHLGHFIGLEVVKKETRHRRRIY